MVLLFSIFQQVGSYCIDKANHIEYHLEYSYNAPSYQAQDGRQQHICKDKNLHSFITY